METASGFLHHHRGHAAGGQGLDHLRVVERAREDRDRIGVGRVEHGLHGRVQDGGATTRSASRYRSRSAASGSTTPTSVTSVRSRSRSQEPAHVTVNGPTNRERTVRSLWLSGGTSTDAPKGDQEGDERSDGARHAFDSDPAAVPPRMDAPGQAWTPISPAQSWTEVTDPGKPGARASVNRSLTSAADSSVESSRSRRRAAPEPACAFRSHWHRIRCPRVHIQCMFRLLPECVERRDELGRLRPWSPAATE